MTKYLFIPDKILSFIGKHCTFHKLLLFIKKRLAISVSKVILNIALFVLGIFLVMGISDLSLHGFNINSSIMTILSSVYFFMIYNLRKIVYSTKSTPFSFDNVKRFKRIGYSMLFMAVLDGIINWKKQSHFEFLKNLLYNGSLKGSFIMYMILACVALVLAQIFEKAVEMKDENDLTI